MFFLPRFMVRGFLNPNLTLPIGTPNNIRTYKYILNYMALLDSVELTNKHTID